MATDLNHQGNPNQDELFFYTADETKCENLLNYRRGGMHPIALGDILPKPFTCTSDTRREPRYRIMMKLGFGSSATVWLARDMVEQRLVAVKVGKDSRGPTLAKEASILHELRSINEPGCERIIKLLDTFAIRGPNGLHECLVLEVVAPIFDADITQSLTAVVAEQVLQGFSFLHSQGIVHGDPHLANLGIALPKLDQFHDLELIEYFSDPHLVPVIPQNPSLASPSLPSYLVLPDSIGAFLYSKAAFPEPSETSIKIIDFGRSYRIRGPMQPLRGGVPLYVRPPEVVAHELSRGRVGSLWSHEADIWAVGSTIYLIACRSEFLRTTGWRPKNDYLLQAIQFGGPAPKELREFMRTYGHQLIDSVSERELAWRRREKMFIRQDAPKGALFALLKEMLVTDPAQRLPMRRLLCHPFFSTTQSAS